MSPLRWDVLGTGFVLAVPVLLLGLRGDISADDVALRLIWCLVAGWAAVALLRLATTPRTPASATGVERDPAPAEAPADSEPATP